MFACIAMDGMPLMYPPPPNQGVHSENTSENGDSTPSSQNVNDMPPHMAGPAPHWMIRPGHYPGPQFGHPHHGPPNMMIRPNMMAPMPYGQPYRTLPFQFLDKSRQRLTF